jgi:aryl-alcohol dehydrogenase-like predicted oxidoreductase
VEQLDSVAKDLGTTLSTLAIAWCIANPNVTTAILGATREEQLAENLKALDVYPRITAEVLAKIDEVMGTKPVLPQY